MTLFINLDAADRAVAQLGQTAGRVDPGFGPSSRPYSFSGNAQVPATLTEALVAVDACRGGFATKTRLIAKGVEWNALATKAADNLGVGGD